MNSSAKVIMAATMVMVVSLVMVLSLVLVLLAELYCSLLLRRRRRSSLTLPTTATATTTVAIAATTNDPSPSSNPLNTGVLQTPKSFFQTKIQNESSLSISPEQILEIKEPIVNDSNHEKPIALVDNFVYISNPIYSNEAATPFETPQSSPSRLETGEENEDSSPKLTPMKDLPEIACSVSVKDAKSLETSASESNSNNNNGGSSSSSGSPYTSPSW